MQSLSGRGEATAKTESLPSDDIRNSGSGGVWPLWVHDSSFLFLQLFVAPIQTHEILMKFAVYIINSKLFVLVALTLFKVCFLLLCTNFNFLLITFHSESIFGQKFMLLISISQNNFTLELNTNI